MYINKKRGWGWGGRGGTGGGLVLTVRHLTGGGVGGGGFLRGDLRFRHSRGGLDLKGGVTFSILPGNRQGRIVLTLAKVCAARPTFFLFRR